MISSPASLSRDLSNSKISAPYLFLSPRELFLGDFNQLRNRVSENRPQRVESFPGHPSFAISGRVVDLYKMLLSSQPNQPVLQVGIPGPEHAQEGWKGVRSRLAHRFDGFIVGRLAWIAVQFEASNQKVNGLP